MIFHESDLTFKFDDNWQVYKFDDHRFYKYLSGQDLKAVDFIAIFKNEFLLLMEVKNYNKRKQSPVAPNIKNILGEEPALVHAFQKKISDSIRAIRAIRTFYERKWWFRVFYKMMPFLKQSETAFWLNASEILDDKKLSVHLVLWLEIAESYPDLSHVEIDLLRRKIVSNAETSFQMINPKIQLVEMNANPYDKHLQVSKLDRNI